MIEVHTLQYLFFSSKTQKCVNGDQIGIRSIVSYVYTLFKNKYILLHIKVKHSNINICATTVHLEKSNGGTTLEESYYKKYSDKKIKKNSDLLLLFKLWKFLKKMLLFSFCSSVSTISFCVWIRIEQSNVQRCAYIRSLYQFTKSS